MNSENRMITIEKYSNESIAQQLALMKVQSEISDLKTYELREKFIEYYERIIAEF